MMTMKDDTNTQTLVGLLSDTVEEGSKLYNDGKKRECFELFLETAKFACSQRSVRLSVVGLRLELAVDEAKRLEKLEQYNEGIWMLRKCFDKIRKEPESKQLAITSLEHETESLATLLRRTIDEGAPLYNKGLKKECFELYLETTRFVGEEKSLQKTTVGRIFRLAINDATKLEQKQDFKTGAWMLRDLFDAILTHEDGTTAASLQVRTPRSIVANIEKVVTVKDRKYHLKTYKQCFVGSEAVTMLVESGLAENREDATDKLQKLLVHGMIQHVEFAHDFQDSYLFYRFASTKFQEPIGTFPQPVADEELEAHI